MKKNDSFEEIYNRLKNSKKILMPLHSNPDGDSLGSCSAMKRFLEKQGKKVKIISYGKLADNLMEMPFSKKIEFGKDITDLNLSNFDLLLVLDTSSQSIIGKSKTNYKLPEGIFTINIDHHRTNNYFGDLNYVSPQKSSTCSVLLDFFQGLKIPVDNQMATMLLLGVCTDSVFFKIKSAESALQDACKLISLGGDYGFIVQKVLFNDKLDLKKFFALVINNFKPVKTAREKKFGYSIIPYTQIKPLDINETEMRLGISELISLKGFDFVFTIIEFKDSIKISFRSSKGVDVSVFAKSLGGGGHKSAAGAFLEKMPIEKAEKIVLYKVNLVLSKVNKEK